MGTQKQLGEHALGSEGPCDLKPRLQKALVREGEAWSLGKDWGPDRDPHTIPGVPKDHTLKGKPYPQKDLGEAGKEDSQKKERRQRSALRTLTRSPAHTATGPAITPPRGKPRKPSVVPGWGSLA